MTRLWWPVLLMGFALVAGAASIAAQPRALTSEGTRPEKRLALIIGNSAYPTSPLRNPVNDARAMARTLRDLGFEVLAHENLGQKEMRRAIIRFGDRLRVGGVGLFFYAGHGLQVAGRNYMVPVDADMKSEAEVEVESVDVAAVLARLETAQNRVNIVILDACRDNPFARRFRSAARGLAAIDAPTGTLIAYATAPGRVARDGEGANGVYTAELLKAVHAPGLKIEDVFKRVRQAVRTQTRGEQVPWESSSLEGDFVFVPAGSQVAAVPAPLEPPKPTIREEIRQQVGSLVLSAKIDGVEVFLGDQRIGDTKQGRALVVENLAAGAHRLTARRQGYKNWEREVQVAANQRAEVVIDIEALRPEPPVTARTEDGSELVLVPAGGFWMGSGDGVGHDMPRHRVYLDAFHIDKHEVTNTLYQRFMNATGHREPRYVQDSKWNHPRQPVVGVSWHDAEAYCRWAGKRLPTEAEWEKAARGTDERRYPWGNEWDKNRANGSESGIGRTTPVGQYPGGASPYGAEDMAGNVSEWVADWYDANYYQGSPERNPRGPEFGSAKVVRGGSYYYQPLNVRSSLRNHHSPDNRFDDFGFRCAKGLS